MEQKNLVIVVGLVIVVALAGYYMLGSGSGGDETAPAAAAE
jgi:hypothetical protein